MVISKKYENLLWLKMSSFNKNLFKVGSGGAKIGKRRRKKRQATTDTDYDTYVPEKTFGIFGNEKVLSSSGSGNKMGLSLVLYANKTSFKMRHNNHDGFKVVPNSTGFFLTILIKF